MNRCGYCGAFIPRGQRFCCDYCARRAALQRKERLKPTVMTLAWRSRIEKIMDGPIEISYQQYTSPFVELDSHYEEWVQSLFQALRVPPEYLFPNRPNQ